MAALASTTALRGQAISMNVRPAARTAAALQPVRASQSLQGRVISTTNAKTAVVAVESLWIHPVYKKRVKVTTKFIAHDETEKAKLGDVVTLSPSRPLSKRKRFVVLDVVQAANDLLIAI